jgi:hypothetical protein
MNKHVFSSIALLWVTGCLLFENEPPEYVQCAAKLSVNDGEPCHCDDDCKSSSYGKYCVAEGEYDIWYPHGVCSSDCMVDADCGENAVCSVGSCYRRCDWTADCSAGRACWLVHGDVAACLPFCDEDADCERGRCNLYSGDCMPADSEPAGLGLASVCRQDGDCRSGRCRANVCETTCDPEYQRCPEGAVCTDDAVCVLACSEERLEDAGIAEDDAGVACD